MANNKVVLVIGTGWREHALCWKLSTSPQVKTVFVAPGNDEMLKEEYIMMADVNVKDLDSVSAFCKKNSVVLVVVDGEEPLANELAYEISKDKIFCFGPSRAATIIKADKDWDIKAFSVRHKIPAARWQSFRDPIDVRDFIKSSPFTSFVVKASGLASGKVDIVADDTSEALNQVETILAERGADGEVIIEELLLGEEVKIMAFSDGTHMKPLLPISDYKISNGQGPTIIEVGAIGSAHPFITEDTMKLVEAEILQRAVDGFKTDGSPFVGLLHAAVVLTKNGPKLQTLHGTFGDREACILLPQLHSDLFTIMIACLTGTLSETEVLWKPRSHLDNNAAFSTDGAETGANQVTESELSHDSFASIYRDLKQEFEERISKLEKQNSVQELMLAQLYIMQNSTAFDCIRAFKIPIYRNTSYDALSKNLLLDLNLQQDSNFFLPLTPMYQAIGALGIKCADGFFPVLVQEAVKSCLHLAGQKVEHHLLWIFKILKEIDDTIALQIKAVCNHTLLQHPAYADALRILGFNVEMATDLIAPPIKIMGTLKLEAKWPIFKAEDTIKDRFHPDNGSASYIVDMMSSDPFVAVCGTWENSTYIIVPLNENLNMMLLKPQSGFTVKDLESKFGWLFMHLLVGSQHTKRVVLKIPKFVASTDIDGIDLVKQLVELSENNSKYKCLLENDEGIRFSMAMEVQFTEGSEDSLPASKRPRSMAAEEVIIVNKPFWFILYYKEDFAMMAGRVDSISDEQQ